ncbi:cAMP-binding proteins - catabolite gene activator and regulatory subunit of cAMP-dependent protein kinases [Tenacibaculum sp. 190524A02b]
MLTFLMEELPNYKTFVKDTIRNYYQVTSTSIDLLLTIAKVQHIQKGDTLLPFGKIAQQVSILYKGTIVSNFLNEDGKEYHKNIFLKGDFVSSTVSCLTQKPSQFSLEAIEDSILISFNYHQYKKLIDTTNDFKNFYIAYLEKNWVIDKEQRETTIVLKEASERYLSFIEKYPNIEKRIPLLYIASHLGITATQLSRIRKKIQEN